MKHISLLITLLVFHLTNAQIENGMVAHFSFDGNVNDLSTSAISATNSGASYGPDRNASPNGAIDFNATYDATFTDNAIKVNFPITISVWAKFNSFNAINNLICSDSDFNNYSGYWFQTLAPTGQLALSFGGALGGASPANRRSYVTTSNLQAGTWYHIVGIIRSHNDMDIYVNCEEVSGTYSGSGSTAITYLNNETKIGSAPGNNANPTPGTCDCSIDQLAIWERELSNSEIGIICKDDYTLSLPTITKQPKELVKIVNILGQECSPVKNTPLFYLYSDGSAEKVVILD